MKTLVYGSLNIDLTFSLDHIVRPGETISSSSLTRSAGGKGANQAAALALAGADVSMAGKIGTDGDFLAERLASYGVNTGHIIRYDGATGQAIIQLDKHGQNSIVLFAGGNGEITLDEIETTLAHFGEGDAVLLQNEIVRIDEIMTRAKQKGMKVYLNPSPFNEQITRLPLEMVDCFFVNELEGAALAETTLAKTTPAGTGGIGPVDAAGTDAACEAILCGLARRFPAAEIILTAGENGAWYASGGLRARSESVKVTAVDTVGAGDTFTGYFIAARNRGYSVEDALRTACKAAALAVSRTGAMESIPRWEETTAFKR